MGAKAKTAKGGFTVARAMPGKRASAKRAAKLGSRSVKLGARTAKRSPSLQALLHDERVHERLSTGLRATQAVYGRVSRGGKGAETLVDDRKTRREVKRAIVSFKGARAAVREAKAKKRRRVGAGAVVGVALAVALGVLAFSENLRQKALSILNGSAGSDSPSQEPAPAAANIATGAEADNVANSSGSTPSES